MNSIISKKETYAKYSILVIKRNWSIRALGKFCRIGNNLNCQSIKESKRLLFNSFFNCWEKKIFLLPFLETHSALLYLLADVALPSQSSMWKKNVFWMGIFVLAVLSQSLRPEHLFTYLSELAEDN